MKLSWINLLIRKCKIDSKAFESSAKWIKESSTGYLVKYGDIFALKERMMKCLLDNAEVKRMVQQGKEYIVKNPNWLYILREVENLYAACAKRDMGQKRRRMTLPYKRRTE